MFSFFGCNSNNAIVWVSLASLLLPLLYSMKQLLFMALLSCSHCFALWHATGMPPIHAHSWFTVAGFHFFIVVTSVLLLSLPAASNSFADAIAPVPATDWIVANPWLIVVIIFYVAAMIFPTCSAALLPMPSIVSYCCPPLVDCCF